jgi:hypothetical protein
MQNETVDTKKKMKFLHQPTPVDDWMTMYNEFVTHMQHQRMPLSIEHSNISVDIDVDMLCTDGPEEEPMQIIL